MAGVPLLDFRREDAKRNLRRAAYDSLDLAQQLRRCGEGRQGIAA
jgi:hypothetical protein